MEKTTLWTFVKADAVFTKLLPDIMSHRHKIRGKNWRGNPADFTDEEKKKINKAVAKMLKDYKL